MHKCNDRRNKVFDALTFIEKKWTEGLLWAGVSQVSPQNDTNDSLQSWTHPERGGRGGALMLLYTF